MGIVLNEGKHAAEFLLYEEEKEYSREVVTIAALAGPIAAGTLLGKLTVGGKYMPYSNAASDGTEVAKAIAYDNIPDATVDQPALTIARQALVAASRLTGLDAAARADLAAIGIIVRD